MRLPVVFVACALILALPGRANEPRATLDEMIGQMLLVGFNGTSAKGATAKRIAGQIARGQIGGVILFNRNIRSPRQVRALTKKFRTAGHPLVPLISVDQEGGKVQRLSAKNGFATYPTARTMARKYTPEQAQRIYRKMAEELSRAGFNMNYGPVVDLNLNRGNPIIARLGRSYGANPAQVTKYARAFIYAHREANVLTSVKHFPGHGSSTRDSHKQFVDISRTWKDIEITPYQMLAREGAIDTVMVGHLYHRAISGKKRVPATLAANAIDGWLRDRVGFQGVVITDDLEMAAIRKHNNLKNTLIKAVQSGNDILLFGASGSDPKFVPKATRILRDAVNDGTIPIERIALSYNRIKRLKEGLAARSGPTGARLGVTQ